jgi:CRISPR/Cas system-associated exonuclease Cas4 (RecB family)
MAYMDFEVIDIPTQPKRKWLSPTAINSYLHCPRKYYYRYIEKRKSKPNIHLMRGLAVHKAIEKFYTHKLDKRPDLDYGTLRKTLLDLFRTEWDTYTKSLLESKLTQGDLAFFRHESEHMMLNFLHDFLENADNNQPSPDIEKTLYAKEDGLLARLDAVYHARDPPLIVDYKTSKSAEVTDEHKRQMGLCAMLYETIYGTRPLAGLHFLKFRDGRKLFRITDTFLEKLRNLIGTIRQKTRTTNITDYPCLCGWCEHEFKGAAVT